MKAVTFSEASKIMDEWKHVFDRKSFWWIEMVMFWIAINFALAMLIFCVEEAVAQAEFRKKYRTIIKVNCFGCKSYEYHER